MCDFCENYDFSRIGIDYDVIGGHTRPRVYHAGGSGTSPVEQRYPMADNQEYETET